MSDKQPEALRLADELVETPFQSTRYIAAAELRRLHEVNQEFLFWMRYILSKDHVGYIHDTARAAIAKATGEHK